MHVETLHRWQNHHLFGQGARRPEERRTLTVIAIVKATVIVAIVAGTPRTTVEMYR